MKVHLLFSSSCGVLAILSLMIKESSALLQSNGKGSPSMLSDTTDVCSSNQGRTASRCEVELDVPASCVDEDGTSSCPVVFFLHGGGGGNDGFKRSSDVHENDVIGVYPQGESGWNTGPKNSNECDPDDFDCSSDPDEGAFVASIISTLRDMGANGNIYAIGSSNGGALANRLGSNAGNSIPIKGFVALVTQLLTSPERNGPGVLNYNQPQGSTPVSVLNVMGTGDGLIPYGGGSSGVFAGDTSFQLYPAIQSMEIWSDYNGCDTGNPIEESVTTSQGDGTGTFYRYPNCSNGAIVEHYAIDGGAHNAGGSSFNDISARDIQYDFIRRCEGAAPPEPTTAPEPTAPTPPMPSPTLPPQDCVDDLNWHGKFNTIHTCDFVASNPSRRCNFESTDGIPASTACKVACDTCDNTPTSPPVTPPTGPNPTLPPVPAPTPPTGPNPTLPPVPAPTPPPVILDDDSLCEDDAAWHGKFSENHDCNWISTNTDGRCGFVNTEDIPANVACPVTCGTCEEDDDDIGEEDDDDIGEEDDDDIDDDDFVDDDDFSCEDDAAWHGKFSESHDCNWVSARTNTRCEFVSSENIPADEACPVTCGTCEEDDNGTDYEDEDEDGCADDPTWVGKFNTAHNCEFVAVMPNVRCNYEDLEQIPANEACRLTCDTCTN